MNYLHLILRFVLDLSRRMINKFKRYLHRRPYFSISEELSDSQEGFYLQAVKKFLTDPNEFKKFRRDFNYREILEHVSYKLGKEYLLYGELKFPNFVEAVKKYTYLDDVGAPIKFHYTGIGKCSPTLIRYVYTAFEIRREIDFASVNSVAEIGVGYGGQFAVLQGECKLGSYIIYDLPEVVLLTKKYVEFSSIPNVLKVGDFNASVQPIFDMVISNYAFSELPRGIQEVYLKNVISKASRGYMIMNSGRTNHTGRSTGKMSLSEISSYLPQMRIIEENPLTSPDNYIIVWDSTKLASESA
jgi:hypothetical protein